jgi:hypothetical protein
MGYRSDIAVVIYPDTGEQNEARYGALKLLMNTTFKTTYDTWSNGDEDFEWHDNHRVLEFRTDSVKWYDSHPEVAAFHAMLDAIGEMEGYNYEFMRIGEDNDDVEEVQRGDDVQYHLGVKRTIEVNL